MSRLSPNPTRRDFVRMAGAMLLGSVLAEGSSAAGVADPDVCVYGATASGIMAAVAAAREGCNVLIVEPSRWLGGMTGGGLDRIDWGNEQAVGGTARTILECKYDNPQYRAAFAALLRQYSIPVLFEHRISSVQIEDSHIHSITLDLAPPDKRGCPVATPDKVAARRIRAGVFIDCTYEGDLMARAGVSHTFGRESRETYGESLAGSEADNAVYGIDPFVKPGNPKSGLIPLLLDIKATPEGSADKLTMGYGFRWKLSRDADRIPIEAPANYDPFTYELYRRGFQNGVDMFRGRQVKYKLGNWQKAGGGFYSVGDCNLQRALWAPTVFGSNAEYPDGDYATRARIWGEQLDFMAGMTHFMRTDPSVTPKWRDDAMGFGFKPGVFDETGGWPHQLYVREARRMQSSYILTQKDLEGGTDPDDSIGLASYGVDEWPYAAYPLDGQVALNGGYLSEVRLDDVHGGIYKIPYRSITPRKEECSNLLVPVCCSASHIAMTSLRMEPVWMILGESAGVAASMAAKQSLPVQKIDQRDLRGRLLALNQRLDRPATPA